MPVVSVILPARNAAPWIDGAVRSLLAQSLADLELLVIDDGSTDTTAARLAAFRDARLRILRQPHPAGVAAALNRGLDVAQGRYIARADADDLSVRNRLHRQVDWLAARPELAGCGSWVRLFGGDPPVVVRQPGGAGVVGAMLLFDNPLFHPTVLLRRDLLARHGLRYDSACAQTEDYDLWTRVARIAPLDNLPAPLVRLRTHPQSVTRLAGDAMAAQTRAIQARLLAPLGLTPDAAGLEFHRRVGHGERPGSLAELRAAEQWLRSLCAANEVHRQYATADFQAAAGWVWRRLCGHAAHLGWSAWQHGRQSPLADAGWWSVAECGRFALAACWHRCRRGASGTGGHDPDSGRSGQ